MKMEKLVGKLGKGKIGKSVFEFFLDGVALWFVFYVNPECIIVSWDTLMLFQKIIGY